MVKFRGIEICIVSQFDICRLPEFRCRKPAPQADPFQNDSEHYGNVPPSSPTASCYVPIYPGSQIWFDYSIDGPHPPGAAYFFKMFINGQAITAWDCTAKHGFHGKMMYNLANLGSDPVTGYPIVNRQALRFGNEADDRERGDGWDGNSLQINVHRIEHRRRIRELDEGLGLVNLDTSTAEGLRLTNSGFLEPGARLRRYKYQLLDPVDMPYATFRFLCRPYEYLERHGIVRLPGRSSSSSSSNSSVVSLVDGQANGSDSNAHELIAEGVKKLEHTSPQDPFSSPQQAVLGLGTETAATAETHVPLSDSEDSLSVTTKDSIEDLPSTVTRSPKSNRPPKKKSPIRRIPAADASGSPTRSPGSARQRLKKKLTLSRSGSEFDFEIERNRRPLSPFTSAGVLRKAGLSQTALPAVTESGPAAAQESRTKLQKTRDGVETKTSGPEAKPSSGAERGGKKFMGLLSRRIVGEKPV